jgi:hypothetical protein
MGAHAADPSIYAGVAGAMLFDSGAMVVTGGGFAREENFEYVRRPDGGVTLLNVITAADGHYRVNARFDYDSGWNAVTAHGTGLYDGAPVAIAMHKAGKEVAVDVRGDGVDLHPRAACDPDCFLNMSPSATAMFVMTRHYDFAVGGEQEFRWAGQDLDRVRTLSGGRARLTFRGAKPVVRATGQTLNMRHFTFIELLPGPDGSTVSLDFDLWTDDEHRPYGFRVRLPGGSPAGTVALRKGFEDVRAAILKD